MAAPSVGGSAVPTSFGGHVHFNRQVGRPNGAGAPVYTGEQSYLWTVGGCSPADWDWWWTQYQRGTAMAFELWSDDTRRTALTFTSGYLWEPQYGQAVAGMYTDVRIEIHYLMPLQA